MAIKNLNLRVRIMFDAPFSVFISCILYFRFGPHTRPPRWILVRPGDLFSRLRQFVILHTDCFKNNSAVEMGVIAHSWLAFLG